MKNAIDLAVGLKYFLVLTGIIVGTVGAMGHSAYRAASLDAENLLSEAIEIENKVLADLGFGGLIHNYQNYVMRNSVNYRAAAIADYVRVLDSLARLERIVPESQHGDIALVRETVRTYRANLDVARVAIARGAGPVEIDALVRVDDTPAVHALKQIMQGLHERLLKEQTRRANDLKVFVRGLLILIVTILLLVLLLIAEAGRIRRNQFGVGAGEPRA